MALSVAILLEAPPVLTPGGAFSYDGVGMSKRQRPQTGGTWIVLGSSPDAAKHLAYARGRWPDARVITGNRGFMLEASPDVYLVFDAEACRRWTKRAYEMQASGTWLVSLFAGQDARKLRNGVERFDEFLRPWPNDWGMTGLWCMYYVARFLRADRVVLAGQQGYPPQGVGYFNGDPTPEAHYVKTLAVIGPKIMYLAADHPDAEFIALGPVYWSLEPSPPNITERLIDADGQSHQTLRPIPGG